MTALDPEEDPCAKVLLKLRCLALASEACDPFNLGTTGQPNPTVTCDALHVNTGAERRRQQPVLVLERSV